MYRLIGAQKSMYFYEKLNPGTSTYHHTVAMELQGTLDVERLKKSLQLLSSRHDVLRSHIAENDNGDAFLDINPQQDPLETAFQFIDSKLKRLPTLQQLPETLQQLNRPDILNAPFDFATGPLWRVALIKLDEDHYQLVFVIHHMIVDIGSQNILLRDLSEIYNKMDEETLDIPYIANVENLAPQKKNHEEQIDFWREYLTDLTPSNLHPDFSPKTQFHFEGDRVYFKLPSELMQSLKDLARRNNISVNSILMTALYTLFYRYTDETDVCLGYVSANRKGYNLDANDYVNCFINSIPLRINLRADQSFETLAQEVAHHIKNTLINQLPLDEVLQEAVSAKTKSSASIATPFSILSNFNGIKTPLNLNSLKISPPIELNLKHTKFQNFGINFDEQPNGSYEGFIEYNTDLFKEETIQRFTKHFAELLSNVVKKPHEKLADLPFLPAEEIALLENAHKTNVQTPVDYFSKIFSRVAAEKKDQTALVYHKRDGSTENLSFAELDKKTDELAAYLQHIGVGPEKPVGISLTRSVNLFVAVLAVLKAGGVVVPLDTLQDQKSSSDARLQNKITNAKVDTILVDDSTQTQFARIGNNQLNFLNVDDNDFSEQAQKLALKYQPPQLDPNQLAYIMYTSGTTGIPKGVMIEQKHLSNLFYAINDRNLPPNAKILLTAPPTFDCFFFEMLEWLSTKGELHFINSDQRLSPSKQEEVISRFGIQCATLLPEVLMNLEPEKLPSLVDVISMGSMAHKEVLDRWFKAGKIIRNEYGPTETTICATDNPYKPSKSFSNVGKPIRNTQIYILDPHQHEQPINVPGELYITGPVARGYVGNPELNAEKFPKMILNPETRKFEVIQSAAELEEFQLKFFVTGDIGKYVLEPNGEISIEILGRRDRKIKLHGNWVELDGMEALIRQHPNIKDVYITLNDSKSALIAYVIPKPDLPFSQNDLDDFLRESAVPAIAWPKQIVNMTSFPLTKNGKIDIKSLPMPYVPTETVDSPKTQLQFLISKIWADILHVEQVDITKTFREQGGDSLGLATLETALNHKLKLTHRIGFNLLSRDINILKLEALIDPLLIDKSKPLNIEKVLPPPTAGITFFGRLKNNSLTLKPIHPNPQNGQTNGLVKSFDSK